MLEILINNQVVKARQDDLVREKLIKKYRSQIGTIAMGICGRSLDWNNDDELSISLIAFNEAIDTYDKDKGMRFLNYAQMLIHHRLVDYFRRESRFQYAPLDTLDQEKEVSKYEIAEAWTKYQDEQTALEQRDMVARYNFMLLDYGISLDDLVSCSPKHRDTKQTLIRVAQALVEQPVLMKQFEKNKQLPVKELMVLTGVGRKVIERGRKYIIAVVLVLSIDEFLPIRQLLRLPQQGGGEGNE